MSLDSQLTMGLRTVELDIYHDPTGGRFYNRLANKWVNEPIESGEEKLKQPGFKIMHAPDFDYRTTQLLFKDALTEIKNWSEKNPNHLPIYVMIEAKDLHFMKFLFPRYCTKVLKFTKNAVDSIDMEIENVFGKNSDKIFTPDLLRGNYKTLNEAVLNNNWPTVKEARGKIFFLFMSSKKAKNFYLEGHPSLAGRKMFVYANENDDEAAFIKVEKPEKNPMLIKRLVRKGYMIKTRTDAHTIQARKGDYSQRDAVFKSGAQIIGTDFFVADNRWPNFIIQFSNRENYQLNPVNTK